MNLVYDEIENNQVLSVSINPYRAFLLSAILTFDLNESNAKAMLTELFSKVKLGVVRKNTEDDELLRRISRYEREFAASTLNFLTELVSGGAIQILKDNVNYQYASSTKVDNKASELGGKLYTLFPGTKYFENSAQADERVVIYEGEIFRAKPNVPSPRRSKFIAEEWDKVEPGSLRKSSRFAEALQANLVRAYNSMVSTAQKSNEAISDSAVTDLSPSREIPNLESSWGGEGKRIFDEFKRLQGISTLFGGYEGSVVGSVDYSAKFLEYLLATSTSKKANSVFARESGASLFGQLEKLFLARSSEKELAGLSFLSSLGSTRSFSHGLAGAKKSQAYNPVALAYKDGIRDRYRPLEPSSYTSSSNPELLLYSTEALYEKVLGVGDLVEGLKNSLDDFGRLEGFAGLGSLEWQLDAMSNSFMPSRVVNELRYGGGLAGALKFFNSSLQSFYSAGPTSKLPSGTLEKFSAWLSVVYSAVERSFNSVQKVFIDSTEFIPNIEFKKTEPTHFSSFKKFLNNVGLRDSEANLLLGAESFKDLITTFSPISDSADLRSFFKAYELCQLVYEFGGDSGVDAYLSFLFSGSELESLLNILRVNSKAQSFVTKYQSVKYPKLIGLLVGLTYAVDPAQLSKFTTLLGNNNLDLLSSIDFLVRSGQKNILKPAEDINLLGPMVSSLVQPYYDSADLTQSADYDQAKEFSASGLKKWKKVLGENTSPTRRSELQGLLEVSVGLTPAELIYILGGPGSYLSPLAETLDGFSGGKLTKFLKMATLVGVSQKLSTFTSSYQANNFKVTSSKFSLMIELLEQFDQVLKTFRIVRSALSNSFEDSSLPANLPQDLQPIFNSVNKSIGVLADVVGGIALDSDLQPTISSTLGISTDSTRISASPGIGNSPAPNRSAMINTITPEQATLISLPKSAPGVSLPPSQAGTDLIKKFIKVDYDQLNSRQTLFPVNDAPSLAKLSPLSKANVSYKVEPISLAKAGNPKILSSAQLGSNYLEPNYAYLEEISLELSELFEKYDPVQSCLDFGGDPTSCARLAPPTPRCGSVLNRAPFAQDPEVLPAQDPSKIYVDRPLGTFPQFKPSNFVLPTNSKAPSYFSYLNSLGFASRLGEFGEPTLTSRSVYPDTIIPSAQSVVLSEYVNSEFGLREYLGAGAEKSEEISCVSMRDPHKFQACMNLIKCKRFRPTDSEPFLKFCPRGTAGGSNK